MPLGSSVCSRPGSDLINRVPRKTIPTFTSRQRNEVGESSSFIEESYLPVTVMVCPAGALKKITKKTFCFCRFPGQQPAQNKYIYLNFIHNF
jgi:hypothetical protein